MGTLRVVVVASSSRSCIVDDIGKFNIGRLYLFFIDCNEKNPYKSELWDSRDFWWNIQGIIVINVKGLYTQSEYFFEIDGVVSTHSYESVLCIIGILWFCTCLVVLLPSPSYSKLMSTSLRFTELYLLTQMSLFCAS